MKRKLLSFILSMCMMVTLMPVTVWADEIGTSGETVGVGVQGTETGAQTLQVRAQSVEDNRTVLDISQGSVNITDTTVSGKTTDGTSVNDVSGGTDNSINPDGYIITGTMTGLSDKQYVVNVSGKLTGSSVTLKDLDLTGFGGSYPLTLSGAAVKVEGNVSFSDSSCQTVTISGDTASTIDIASGASFTAEGSALSVINMSNNLNLTGAGTFNAIMTGSAPMFSSSGSNASVDFDASGFKGDMNIRSNASDPMFSEVKAELSGNSVNITGISNSSGGYNYVTCIVNNNCELSVNSKSDINIVGNCGSPLFIGKTTLISDGKINILNNNMICNASNSDFICNAQSDIDIEGEVSSVPLLAASVKLTSANGGITVKNSSEAESGVQLIAGDLTAAAAKEILISSKKTTAPVIFGKAIFTTPKGATVEGGSGSAPLINGGVTAVGNDTDVYLIAKRITNTKINHPASGIAEGTVYRDITSSGLYLDKSSTATASYVTINPNTGAVGTVKWIPTLTNDIITGGTVELDNAYIDTDECNCLYVNALLSYESGKTINCINVKLTGTNVLNSKNESVIGSFYELAFSGNGSLTISTGGQYKSIRADKITVSENASVKTAGKGYSLITDCYAGVEVIGNGKFTGINLGYNVTTEPNVKFYPTTVYGKVTVDAGTVLDLTQDYESLSFDEGAFIVNNGTIKLIKSTTLTSGTSTTTITNDIDTLKSKISGTGIIQLYDVSSVEGSSSPSFTLEKVYSCADGTEFKYCEHALDFSQSAADGNWKGDATLDNDGYQWDATDNTLTIKDLYMFTNSTIKSPCIKLPYDSELIVMGTNTLKGNKAIDTGENPEYVYVNGSNTIAAKKLTISGDGELDCTEVEYSIDISRLEIKDGVTLNMGSYELEKQEEGRYFTVYGNAKVNCKFVFCSEGEIVVKDNGQLKVINNDTQYPMVVVADRITVSGGSFEVRVTQNCMMPVLAESGIDIGTDRAILTPVGGKVMSYTDESGTVESTYYFIVPADVTEENFDINSETYGPAKEVVIGAKPTSGGHSGSGGSSSSSTTTSTTTNSDGSTTTTVTNPSTGTVTETTKGTDGSTTITETKKDGTVTETAKDAAGNSTVTEKKPDGTVTETVKDTAGNSSITETKADGSLTSTSEAKDGTKTSAEVKADGTANISISVPAAATNAAEGKAEISTPIGTVTIPKQLAGKDVQVSIDVKPTTGTAQGGANNGNAGKIGTVNVTVKADGQKNGAPVKVKVNIANLLSPKSGTASADGNNTSISDANTPMADSPDAADHVTKPEIVAMVDGKILVNAYVSGEELILSDFTGGEVEIVDNTKNFNDVAGGFWGVNGISFVTARELFNGLSDTEFGPDVAMSRAMLVTVLNRMEGEADASAGGKFADVASGSYYEKAVAWASENGIVGGYSDTTFAPNDDITREQLAAILYRYAKLKGVDTTQGGMAAKEFDDYASISSYATEAMGWAVNAGMLQGSDNKLDPKGKATRAQVATILMRYVELAAK